MLSTQFEIAEQLSHISYFEVTADGMIDARTYILFTLERTYVFNKFLPYCHVFINADCLVLVYILIVNDIFLNKSKIVVHSFLKLLSEMEDSSIKLQYKKLNSDIKLKF